MAQRSGAVAVTCTKGEVLVEQLLFKVMKKGNLPLHQAISAAMELVGNKTVVAHNGHESFACWNMYARRFHEVASRLLSDGKIFVDRDGVVRRLRVAPKAV